MSERLILKGKLGELKMQKMKLEASIDSNVRACKMMLAEAIVSKIAEMDLESAQINLNEAVAQKKELDEVIGQIKKIEKELA